MAWTAPITFAAAAVLTAAQLNTNLRDNLNETAPAKVTTAGDLVYATAANALTRRAIGAAGSLLASDGSAPQWRVPAADFLNETDTFTSTGYVDLDFGP